MASNLDWGPALAFTFANCCSSTGNGVHSGMIGSKVTQLPTNQKRRRKRNTRGCKTAGLILLTPFPDV